jgi:uncharacterized membrane protein YdbT with pleckstrin-like domain
MSYTKESLLKDEKIVYYTRPHYIIFYTIFLWLMLAIFMTKVANSTFLALIMVLMGLACFIGDLISYYFSEYVITNRRIIMKVGFIRRQSLEVFLERIEGIYVEQGIIGRILNFGTVIIAGIGGTKNPFFYIPDPIKFRSDVQQQIETTQSIHSTQK